MKINRLLNPNECRYLQDKIVMQDIPVSSHPVYDSRSDDFKIGSLSFPTEDEAQQFLDELEEESENDSLEL